MFMNSNVFDTQVDLVSVVANIWRKHIIIQQLSTINID